MTTISIITKDADSPYLEKSVASVAQQDKNLFVAKIFCPKGVARKMKKYGLPVVGLESQTITEMVNEMVSFIDTEFVLLMGANDLMSPKYMGSLGAHMGAYPEVDMFLGLSHEVNPQKEFMGLKNSLAWAYSVMPEFGKLSLEETKNALDFTLDGAAIRTSVLKKVAFKHNIPLYWDKEYLLRFLRKGHLAYVVPKIAVIHVQEEPTLDSVQRTNLIKAVRFEYMFDEDRKVEY